MSESDFDRAFDFLRVNDRPDKPRERGITEIRGPYYDPMGPRELRDILETVGHYVDIYKFYVETSGVLKATLSDVPDEMRPRISLRCRICR